MINPRTKEIKKQFNAEHYSGVHADFPRDLAARFKAPIRTGIPFTRRADQNA